MALLRYLTAGESHGPMLLAILEGMPAGVPVRQDEVDRRMRLRQLGPGRGGRQKIEHDRAEFVAGLRGGQTLGSPIGIIVRNRDWDNWRGVLGPGEADVDPERAEAKALYRPRPGHADLAGALKYELRDLRDVLERASARETAARVAVGAVCAELLAAAGIRLLGRVTALGPVTAASHPGATLDELAAAVEASDCRCADPDATAAMHEAIRAATLSKDTLGGVIEVVAEGLPVGLGSYAASDRRLDGRLAGALMSIQAMKAVEVGLGLQAAATRGSGVQDEILVAEGTGSGCRYVRPTNRAGGVEGGMSNGEPLVVRAAMKPIPTLLQPLRSVDMRTGVVEAAAYERSDITSVPAASVVAEHVVAFVLAQALLEKFGGDSLDELRRNMAGYAAQVGAR